MSVYQRLIRVDSLKTLCFRSNVFVTSFHNATHPSPEHGISNNPVTTLCVNNAQPKTDNDGDFAKKTGTSACSSGGTCHNHKGQVNASLEDKVSSRIQEFLSETQRFASSLYENLGLQENTKPTKETRGSTKLSTELSCLSLTPYCDVFERTEYLSFNKDTRAHRKDPQKGEHNKKNISHINQNFSMNGKELDVLLGLDYLQNIHHVPKNIDSLHNFTALDNDIFEKKSYKLDLDGNCIHILHQYENCIPSHQIINLRPSELENIVSSNVLFCDKSVKASQPDGPPKPNLDQLNLLRDHFAEYLPRFFVSRHDYRVYRQDIVFENNYTQKPYTAKGLSAYVYEVLKLRSYVVFKYANTKVHLLKITVHEDESCVRIRWRISGIPNSRAFMFWKFLPWIYKKSKDDNAKWMDGISTMYVDSNGIVAKHVMDRVIPDTEQEIVKPANRLKKLVRLGNLSPGAI